MLASRSDFQNSIRLANIIFKDLYWFRFQIRPQTNFLIKMLHVSQYAKNFQQIGQTAIIGTLSSDFLMVRHSFY
jgi:hypothetical protein